MGDSINPLRRQDDLLMGQILAELKSMNGKVDKAIGTLDELRYGETQLPQCRDNTRRIEDLEKK